MADTFRNYRHLLDEKNGEDVDFKIIVECVEHSPICIVAPHAGRIEFFTSNISRAIAGDNYSLYLFEGIMEEENIKLHITSSNFDEPQALEIVGKHRTVLGIHGCRSSKCSETICIGGLDESLKRALASQFDQVGFQYTSTGHNFPAKKQFNICNRGTSKKGAQIELRHDFRGRLQKNSKLLSKFACAVRRAIANYCG